MGAHAQSIRCRCALAASLATVDLVALITSPQSPGPDTQGPSFFGAGFLLLETVPLAWRRRRPVLVFILVTIGFILYQGGQFPNAPQLGLVIALYGIGAYCDRRTARRTAGVAIPLLTVFTVMGVIFTDELDAIDVVPSVVILVTVSWQARPCGPDVHTLGHWRSAPRCSSESATKRRAARWKRSGSASPANSMTSSLTT